MRWATQMYHRRNNISLYCVPTYLKHITMQIQETFLRNSLQLILSVLSLVYRDETA